MSPKKKVPKSMGRLVDICLSPGTIVRSREAFVAVYEADGGAENVHAVIRGATKVQGGGIRTLTSNTKLKANPQIDASYQYEVVPYASTAGRHPECFMCVTAEGHPKVEETTDQDVEALLAQLSPVPVPPVATHINSGSAVTQLVTVETTVNIQQPASSCKVPSGLTSPPQNTSSSSSKRSSLSSGQLSPTASVQEFIPALNGIAVHLRDAIQFAVSDPAAITYLNSQVDNFVKTAATQVKDRCKLQELLNQQQHQKELLKCKRRLADLHCRQLLEVIAKSIHDSHVNTAADCLVDVKDEHGHMGSFRQVLHHASSTECVCHESKQLLNDLELDSSHASHASTAYGELSQALHTLDGGVLYLLEDIPVSTPALRHALKIVKIVASREHFVVELV